MTATGWIMIEHFNSIIEQGLLFYLLCSKFSTKHKTVIPVLLTIFIIFVIGAPKYFISSSYFVIIDAIMLSIPLIYLIFFRNGSILRKIFWVLLSVAILAGNSFISISSITFIHNINNSDIIIAESSIARLQAMILARILQFVIFYLLSRRKEKYEKNKIMSLTLCFIIPAICAISSLIIYDMMLDELSNIPNLLLYVIAMSYLMISVVVFALYEIITKEISKNFMLIARQNKYEMIEQHNNEVAKIYSQMREWRHDHINHMQVVLTFLKKKENKNINEAINYIKKLDEKITISSSMVSTGNFLADAIISAKKTLSFSHNINFEYIASLPENLYIDDTDLCSILSNLLDNAIEACCKVENSRYIKFKIIVVKNQLYIEIINSTNGNYIRKGNKFLTTKKGAMHGIGLNYIESIIERYNGLYNTVAGTDSFQTIISLPLRNID